MSGLFSEQPLAQAAGAQTALPNVVPTSASMMRTEDPSIGLNPSRLQKLNIPHTQLLRVPKHVYFSIVIINVLGLVLPISILQVYDRVIPNSSNSTLFAIGAILVAAALFEAALRIARLYIDSVNSAKFSHNISVSALRRLLAQQSTDLWKQPTSKILDRLDAVARLGTFYGGMARQVVIDLPFSAIYFIAIWMIGGVIVVVPVAILVFFGLMTLFYGRVLGQTISEKDAQDSKNFDFISEVLVGISTVKGLATESFMMRRFERLEKASARLTYDLIEASDRGQILAGTLGNITVISIATVGAVLAMQGEMTIGSLAACSMLSGRAIQPILRVAGVWNEYQATKLTLRDAAEIFSGSEKCAERIDHRATEAPDISMERVCHFPEHGHSEFRDVSMRIRAGDIVSICGPDGVGKSTLLRLFSGLVEPSEGTVLIAGARASTYRNAYTNAIGYVSHETQVFHGSILENLTLFGVGCSQEAAFATCQLLGLEEEIFRLPTGYETRLGSAAVEVMPAGFIQRILIARAVAQKPSVLILDEAQSFLDGTSDLRLRECLRDMRMITTIILVTNRPDYVEMCDKIFDVGLGSVTERAA